MHAFPIPMTAGQPKPPQSTGETATPLTDGALMAGIAQGDRVAFRRLMERHGARMLATAQKILGSARDADDVVQDAFIKVWSQAGRWQSLETAQFSTWIHRVILNQCIDRKRKRGFQPLEDAGDPAFDGPDGFDTLAVKSLARVLGDAIDALPDRQAEALRAYYYAELTAPDAAEIMEMSLSAYEALLFRARRALKSILAARGISSIGEVLI